MYYRRIEAVEFAVRYDDGKTPEGKLADTCFGRGIENF